MAKYQDHSWEKKGDFEDKVVVFQTPISSFSKCMIASYSCSTLFVENMKLWGARLLNNVQNSSISQVKWSFQWAKFTCDLVIFEPNISAARYFTHHQLITQSTCMQTQMQRYSEIFLWACQITKVRFHHRSVCLSTLEEKFHICQPRWPSIADILSLRWMNDSVLLCIPILKFHALSSQLPNLFWSNLWLIGSWILLPGDFNTERLWIL